MSNALPLNIGSMVIQVSQLQDRVQQLTEEKVQRFVLLEGILLSDQLAHDQAQQILDKDPEFAGWYQERRKS